MENYQEPPDSRDKPYVYQPLLEHRTRIIVLQESENFYDPIQCTLSEINITMEEKSRYAAAGHRGATFMDESAVFSSFPQRVADVNLAESVSDNEGRAEDTDGEPELRIDQDLGQQQGSRGEAGLLGDTIDRYSALSYCWGDTSRQYGISCHGKSVKIRANLLQALLRLRSRSTAVRLWVDAICIDQANPEERGHQVYLMDRIFTQAREVLVWLGDESAVGDGALCMEFFRSAAERLSNARMLIINSSGFAPSEWVDEWTREVDQTCWEVFGSRPLRGGRSEFHGSTNGFLGNCPPILEAFFRRSWFSRRWIVQEIFCGTPVKVFCGPHTASWLDVVLVCQIFFGLNMICAVDSPFAAPKQLPAQRSVRTALPLLYLSPGSSRGYMNAGSIGIIECLEAFHNFECAEDRDRIYAFIGICNFPMAPSYRLSVEDTYRSFAKICIEHGWVYVILRCAARRRYPSKGGKKALLPSWVPDWRIQTNMFRSVETYPRCSAKDFSLLSAHPEVVRKGSALKLFGKVLDFVLEVESNPLVSWRDTFKLSSGKSGETRQNLTVTQPAPGELHSMSFPKGKEVTGVRGGDVVVHFNFLVNYGEVASQASDASMTAILRPVPYDDVPTPEVLPQAKLVAILDHFLPGIEPVVRWNASMVAELCSDLVMSGFMDPPGCGEDERAFYDPQGVPKSRGEYFPLIIV